MQPLIVRRATPNEVNIVASVLGEAQRWLTTRGEPLWELGDVAPAALTPEVNAGHYFIGYGIRAGGPARGVLLLTLEDPEFWPGEPAGLAAYVHRLAVRRNAAGGVTSRALLDWAASEARQHGCRYLRLDCDFARPRLRAVYERAGFRFHSEFQAGPYHVARYELELGAAS